MTPPTSAQKTRSGKERMPLPPKVPKNGVQPGSSGGNMTPPLKILHKQGDSSATELQDIKLQLQGLNYNYSELLSSMNEIACLIKRVESLETKLEEMQIVNDNQDKTIKELQGRLNNAEQYTRRDSIEIREIPVSENENVEEIVLRVAQNIDVPLTSADISVAHRLKSKAGYIPGIIVKLTSRKAKNSLIEKKRNITLKQSDFIPGDYAVNKIYMGESLSPFNRRLLASTKKTAKEAGYKYIWWRNGVRVRKEDDSSIIRIDSEDDILLKL